MDKVALFAFGGDPLCLTPVLHGLYQKVRQCVPLLGACKACATGMGSLEAAPAQELHLLDEMAGHPSRASFIEQGRRLLIP